MRAYDGVHVKEVTEDPGNLQSPIYKYVLGVWWVPGLELGARVRAVPAFQLMLKRGNVVMETSKCSDFMESEVLESERRV